MYKEDSQTFPISASQPCSEFSFGPPDFKNLRLQFSLGFSFGGIRSHSAELWENVFLLQSSSFLMRAIQTHFLTASFWTMSTEMPPQWHRFPALCGKTLWSALAHLLHFTKCIPYSRAHLATFLIGLSLSALNGRLLSGSRLHAPWAAVPELSIHTPFHQNRKILSFVNCCISSSVL